MFKNRTENCVKKKKNFVLISDFNDWKQQCGRVK